MAVGWKRMRLPMTETYTYTLSGINAASFDIDIDTGQLRTKAALDHETKDTYTVTVTANDGELDSDAKTVTITVTDEAELPVFEEGERTVRRVNENTEPNQNIGDPVVATDSDGNTVTYNLTVGNTLFDIVTATGQLKTQTALDHEAMDSHTVTVSASDGVGAVVTISVTIIVNDVNDQPVFVTSATVSDPITSATRTVDENTEPNQNIGDPVVAMDDDADDTLTYSLRGTDSPSFNIDTTNGQLMTKAMLNHETKQSYAVTVRVEDGEGGRDDIPVAITVTDVNEAPKFPSGPIKREVAENDNDGADIGAPVVVTDDPDPEVGAVAYSIADGMPGSGDSAPFAIDNNGQLTLRSGMALDREKQASYTIEVTATDRIGDLTLTATVMVVIDVKDVDEAPTFIDANGNPITVDTRTVVEGVGGNIGAPVVAMDPEKKTVIYKLTGDDKDPFTIGTNGQLKTTAAGLDYENPTATSGNMYQVVVEARDLADEEKANTATITVTITVTNVAEPPMFSEGASTTRSVREETASGTDIGAVLIAVDHEVDDLNQADTLTYSLSGTDASSFMLGGAGGNQLQTKDPLDYEASPTKRAYKVTVRAIDSGGLYDEIMVTITVDNIDEKPMFPVLSTIKPYVYEGIPAKKSLIRMESWWLRMVTKIH